MQLHALLTFWSISAALVLTPGADWAYTISAGIRSRRAVPPAVLGLAIGVLLGTAVVAAGLGALVASHPGLLAAITLAGAIYLAWIGLGLVLHPAIPATVGEPAHVDAWRWFARGMGVSGLNPKLVLLFLALLPQFVAPDARWPAALQVGVLGAIHAATCAAVYLVVGFGAQRVLAARPSAARSVSRVSGIVILAFAALLLADMLHGAG